MSLFILLDGFALIIATRCLYYSTAVAEFRALPEIWDKMATDMRTLIKYGDQILL
jgi:hypothetical protein